MNNLKPTQSIETVEAEEIIDNNENKFLIPVFETPKGLEQTDAQRTLALFQDSFDELAKWELAEREIVVKDENDFNSMQLARNLRLNVRNIRTAGANLKKEQKRDLLIKERYIDSIYGSLESLCKMVENRALDKEETIERLMEAKRQRVFSERALILTELGYTYQHLDLINMPDNVFDGVVNDAKDLKELREAKALKQLELEKEAEAEAERQKEKDKKTTARYKTLSELGLVSSMDIGELTDDDFALHCKELNDIKLEKAEQEKKDKEAERLKRERWNQRDRELESIGFGLDKHKGRTFASAYQQVTVTITDHEIDSLDEKKWKALIKKSIIAINNIKEADKEEEKKRTAIMQLKMERTAAIKLLDARVTKHIDSLELLDEEDWNSLYYNLKTLSDEIIKQDEDEKENARKLMLSEKELAEEYFNNLMLQAVDTVPEITNKRAAKIISDLIARIGIDKVSILKIFADN